MYISLKLCKPRHSLTLLICLVIMLISILFSSMKVYAEDGNTSSTTISRELIHQHVGSSSSGGACYKKAVTETVTHENRCKGEMIYFAAWDTTQCNICGASASGNKSGTACNTTHPTTTTRTTYKQSCGHTNGESIGYFKVTPDTLNWARQVSLSFELAPADIVPSENPFILNGNNIEGSNFVITDNGAYNASFSADSTMTYEPISLNINNIDNTAPTINVSFDDTPDLPSAELIVEANDLQPDGTPGCGLDAAAYSFDGGQTWSSSASYTVKANGDYNIIVRDALGNSSSSTVAISNIKIPEPPKKDDKTPDSKDPDDKDSGDGDSDDKGTGDSSSGNKKPGNTGNNKKDPEPDTPPSGDDGGNTPPAPPANVEPPITTPPAKFTNKVPKKKETEEKTEEISDNTQKITGPVKPFPTPTPSTKKETVKLPTTTQKTQAPPREVIPAKSNAVEEPKTNVGLIIALSVLCAAALLLLIFFLYRLVAIYNYEKKEKYVLKGFGFIHNKEDVLYTNVSESIVDSCDTNVLILKPSSLFKFFHKEEDLTIYLPDNQTELCGIREEIKIRLKTK